jgi:hypothetical protein
MVDTTQCAYAIISRSDWHSRIFLIKGISNLAKIIGAALELIIFIVNGALAQLCQPPLKSAGQYPKIRSRYQLGRSENYDQTNE